MGHVAFFLAAWMNCHRLFLRTGDLDRLPGLGLLDFEIGQVEFLAAGRSTADSRLDLFYPVVPQSLVSTWTAIAAIRIECFQFGALCQVGQGFFHQFGIIGATCALVINCRSFSGSHVSLRLAA